MQLIDADEFIEGLEDLYQRAGWDRRDVHFSLADTIANMEMMPTVEAIPMWFIKGCQSDHLIFITELLNAWEERKEE